jgi:hypothetical protein
MVKEVSEPILCIVTGEISGPVVVEFTATDGIRAAVHLTQAGMLRTEQSCRSPSSRPRTRSARPIRSTPPRTNRAANASQLQVARSRSHTGANSTVVKDFVREAG